MRKPSREFLFIIALFTLVSLWSNHAHLALALAHRLWWYLGFYAFTYVLSIAIISILAFTLNNVGKKAKEV